MGKMNSKSIGNQYERECAKVLSKWITGSSKDLVCWRASHSGSVGSVREKKGQSGKHVDGDFQCLDLQYENFFERFFIDSKSLGDVHIFLTNPKNKKSNQLLNEIVKVFDDAKKRNKIPMLIVKARNDRRIPDFVVVPDSLNTYHSNYIKYEVELNDSIYKFKFVTQIEFFYLNTYDTLMKNNKDFEWQRQSL